LFSTNYTHALYSLIDPVTRHKGIHVFAFPVFAFHSLLQTRGSKGVVNLWNQRGHVIFWTNWSRAFHTFHSTDYPPHSAFHILQITNTLARGYRYVTRCGTTLSGAFCIRKN